MALTIMETLVRNKEQRRRYLDARRQGKTLSQVTAEEAHSVLASFIAGKLARCSGDATPRPDTPRVTPPRTAPASRAAAAPAVQAGAAAAAPVSPSTPQRPVDSEAAAAPDCARRPAPTSAQPVAGPPAAAPLAPEPAAGPRAPKPAAAPPAITVAPAGGEPGVAEVFGALREDIRTIVARMDAMLRELRTLRENGVHASAPHAPASPAPAAPAPEETRIPIGDIAGMIDQLGKHYR